jgi:anion transporter
MFQRWMDLLGIPVAVVVFVGLYLMPTPSGLTLNGQMALAIFFGALVLWVSQAIPTYVTSLLCVCLLITTGTWTEARVLGVFGQDVIWLMLCAFVLTAAMSKANLARRLALFMVTSFSRSAKWALLSMIILNGILAFLVPSTTARAALILPIVLILADVYGAKPGGTSNFGVALMNQEIQANNIFTSGIMTATACNVMAVGYIKELGGQEIYYSDWLFAMFPITIIVMLISWVIGLVLYPPEHNTPQGRGLDDLKVELKNMGPLSVDEWRALFIFALVVFLWSTDFMHVQWWGFPISTATAAVIAATLCLLPGIGLITWKESNIPWELMIFSVGAYSVGLALENSGAARWIMDYVFAASGIKSMSFFSAYVIVILVAMFSHFIFTSKIVRTAIVIPVVIGLAKTMGYSPAAFALPAAFTMCWSITLPPHCKPNLIFYGTGYFTIPQQLMYGMLICVIGSVLLILAGPTWFTFLGFMQ